MSDPLTAAIVWGIIWFFAMYLGPILAQILTVILIAVVGENEVSYLGSSRKRRRSVKGPLAIVVILAWIGAFAWVVFCIIQWVLQIVSIIQIATA